MTRERTDDVERVAAKLHELLCGCAAAPDDWCDSYWVVLAERVTPVLRARITNIKGLEGEAA